MLGGCHAKNPTVCEHSLLSQSKEAPRNLSLSRLLWTIGKPDVRSLSQLS